MGLSPLDQPVLLMHDESSANLAKILGSPSYRVAYKDMELLAGPELRSVRVELEVIKPDLYLQKHNIRSTIVVFGSTRIIERSAAEARLQEVRDELRVAPNDPLRRRAVAHAERLLERSRYYDEARALGRLVSEACQQIGPFDYVIITGGGPGIMEAANRGAYDVGAKSIGLNIRLPREQQPNPYITPDLCFQFHYFAMRKLHFLLRAKALVAFPGGFGTFDELFDALALRQNGRMQKIPVILFGPEFWRHAVDFQFLADEGVISDEDLDLLNFADTAEEAWGIIRRFYGEKP
jgi:uncharacterized protein (TIGR00730 family)